jgi:presequence protease
MLMYSSHSFKHAVKFRSRPAWLMSTASVIPTNVKNSLPPTPLVQHPAYTVLESTLINEYGLQATLYSHQKTGAQIISVIAPQDDNKVFGISFRTPPDDSTGLPHILEHSVLCGSRKYPVKEPFVDLLKGSLQNFLNAFTYPDRTCYPVASTNTKDFYNLVNVYLDAVLHPRAINDPMVLQQEGWHYEIDGDDATKEKSLSIKGVVYNEMKGVYSSPDSLLGRATQQGLFPDNTYGVDSGGDPDAIPTLTYDKFKNFHANYYHPSNSRIFFYGNDDPMKRLELLDEYLADFSFKPVDSKIKFQSKFSAPKSVTVHYPIDASAAQKHMISLNWVMNFEPLSMKEQLAIGVMDSLLVGTPTSSLRKELTQSNLGESIIGGGLSDELLQATYSVGLKGVLPENVDKVESLILKTLQDLTEKGFEADAIEAAINTLEFRLREFNTGGFPRGLSLMLGMVSRSSAV